MTAVSSPLYFEGIGNIELLQSNLEDDSFIFKPDKPVGEDSNIENPGNNKDGEDRTENINSDLPDR